MERIDVVLIDLSKDFDTSNYSLLLTRLEDYGYSMTFLKNWRKTYVIGFKEVKYKDHLVIGQEIKQWFGIVLFHV